MRRVWIGCTLVIASILVPASGRAQTTSACEPQTSLARGGWILNVSYRPQGVPVNNLRQLGIGMHYVPGLGDQALVFLLGGIPISDGTSSTVLVSEAPPTLSCSDEDGDGRIGLVRLQFLVRDVRTGELAVGVIVPNDGELDDDGEEEVTIVIGDRTFVGDVRAHFYVFGTELPPGPGRDATLGLLPASAPAQQLSIGNAGCAAAGAIAGVRVQRAHPAA